MPLDRSGAVAGTISLSVERKLANATPSRDAVVALAGGPGQAALPLSEFIAQAIAPALSSRDLLVFDQRGTGASDPLSCAAFEAFSARPASELFEQCATAIGPARGAFTSEESVEDIEAMRKAGGYEKLVLYGTSYGTRVALDYAERYPQNVEALVLDSVVPAEGQEPFAIPTFQAISGVLAELCEDDACAGITSNPIGEIASLTAQLRKRALSGSVYDGSGKRHASSLDEQGLLDILEAGDLNPALRALLPAAVRSALDRDPDPLLRLHLLSEGLIPNVPIENISSIESSQEIDEALFVTTSCEEEPFPWQRAAPAATRLSEALAYLHTRPTSDFYPFDDVTAYSNSLAPGCAGWPDASAAPPGASALPNVPTLILSGEQDLRTPTADARRVAALIPDAQLLVVPLTGHSVIGSDISDCASLAVKAFFFAQPVQPCAATADPFAPTPVTPTKLSRITPPAAARRQARTNARRRARHAARLQPPADRRHAAGQRAAAERLELRRPARRLRQAHLIVGDPQGTVVRPRRQADRDVPRSRRQAAVSRYQASPERKPPPERSASARASTRITGTLADRHFDVDLAKVSLARRSTRRLACATPRSASCSDSAHSAAGEPLRSPWLP